MNDSQISVVIPVYNEEQCLPELRARVGEVMDGLDVRYDVYLIDDASTDDTTEMIRSYAMQDDRWHGVFLARNFGHQAAITAGLRIAGGDAVVVMDGDLQDQPEAIPRMVELWEDGFDTVYAIRVKRKERWTRRMSYWLYYRLLGALSGHHVPCDAGDFCLMSRQVVDAMNAMPERIRFVRGLRAWVGFRQTGIPVERGRRIAGNPKYTFVKLVRLAMDGIMDFSWVPLRAVSVAGVVAVAASFIYLAAIIGLRLFNQIDVAGWTTVVFFIIFLGGMNLFALGVIGEYLGRTYLEAKKRPTYIIASTTDRKQTRRPPRRTSTTPPKSYRVDLGDDSALEEAQPPHGERLGARSRHWIQSTK